MGRSITGECSVLLFSFCLFVASVAAYDLYKDASQPVEARVTDLLGRMTLPEKVGQMTQIERNVCTGSELSKLFIGSLLNGGGSHPTPDYAPAWQDMIDDFQAQAMSTRLAIPMLYGLDAVHGHNNVLDATIFPHNVGLGCTRDPDLVKRIGAVTALEVRATGIPYVFAPCVAVCRDPRWGRCFESYSEVTNVVRNMTELITGLQGDPIIPGEPTIRSRSNVAACAKHFVGDGGTTDGVDEDNTVASYEDLVNIHMAPYFDAIAKGVSTVMVSYSSWNGMKMHTNKFLITEVLKGQLNFKGFVISDWEAVDRITTPFHLNYTDSVLKVVNAGIDMIMVPYTTDEFITSLTTLVESGLVKQSRVDDAVTRILRVKFAMGLFEFPYSDRSLSGSVGVWEHRLLAREAVRKSMVLLKNGKISEEPLLPLSKDSNKVLVVGTHANDIGLQCGGWTIGWQGEPGNITKGTTILQGIQAIVSPSTELVYERNPPPGFADAQGVDYAIVVVGEPPYVEGAGDSVDLELPQEGIAAIQNVCGEVKCVVVLVTGRPVVIEPHLHLIDALVAAWLPGTEGNGVADVLFGDFNFVGTNSRTWFKSVDQLPMNYGDAHYDPLFPFGFGLKYGSLIESVTKRGQTAR